MFYILLFVYFLFLARSTRRGTPHLLASLIVIVSVPFIAFQFFCLQVFYLDGRDHYRLWKSRNCHDLFCTHTNYQYCGGRAEASIPRTPGGGLNHRNGMHYLTKTLALLISFHGLYYYPQQQQKKDCRQFKYFWKIYIRSKK